VKESVFGFDNLVRVQASAYVCPQGNVRVLTCIIEYEMVQDNMRFKYELFENDRLRN
jgi:hypothetical protein